MGARDSTGTCRGKWALAVAGHRLTLQIHEDEPRRVGLLAVQRSAGPVQDVGAQLPRRLPDIGWFAQRSILGRHTRLDSGVARRAGRK